MEGFKDSSGKHSVHRILPNLEKMSESSVQAGTS
jgi:hypothetical protein